MSELLSEPVGLAYVSVSDLLASLSPGMTAGRADTDAEPDWERVRDSLLGFWREIFGRDDIAETDDFFHLGGHSLKALQLQTRIQTAFGYEMEIRRLFEAPTIAELVDLVCAEAPAARAAPRQLSGEMRGLTHFRLEGLDPSLLERSLWAITARHETPALNGDRRPSEAGSNAVRALVVVDLCDRDADEREVEAQRLMALDAQGAADVNGRLLTLYKMDASRYIVHVGVQLVTRGLLREVLAQYGALADGESLDEAATPNVPPVDAPRAAAVRDFSHVLIPFRAEGERLPLFCVHGIDGGVFGPGLLTRLLDARQPFYGIQSSGYRGQGIPFTRIEPMAAYYIDAIRSVQPEGPYDLCGHSFGGIVAFEMAQQLHAQGQTVSLLALFDTMVHPDHAPIKIDLSVYPSSPGFLRRRLADAWNVLRLPWREKLPFLRARKTIWRRELRVIVRLRQYARLERAGQPIPPKLVDIGSANLYALRHYRLHPYPGKVTLIQAQDVEPVRRGAMVEIWQALAAGGLDVFPVPGGHSDLVNGQGLEHVARALRQLLQTEPNP